MAAKMVLTFTDKVFRPHNDANLRTTAYEAISAYMIHARYNDLEVVAKTLENALGRMEFLLNQVSILLNSFTMGELISSCSLVGCYGRIQRLTWMIVQTGTSYRAISAVSSLLVSLLCLSYVGFYLRDFTRASFAGSLWRSRPSQSES